MKMCRCATANSEMDAAEFEQQEQPKQENRKID